MAECFMLGFVIEMKIFWIEANEIHCFIGLYTHRGRYTNNKMEYKLSKNLQIIWKVTQRKCLRIKLKNCKSVFDNNKLYGCYKIRRYPLARVMLNAGKMRNYMLS